MSSRRRLGFLAIVPVVLLNLTVAACGNDAATRTSTAGIDDGDTVDPVGRTFVSTEVRGHDLVEGTSVNLSFEPDQVSVSAACNTFTGPASRNDGTLAINADSLGRDDDGLPPELQSQDDWLTGFLRPLLPLKLDGSTLTIGDMSRE